MTSPRCTSLFRLPDRWYPPRQPAARFACLASAGIALGYGVLRAGGAAGS